MAEFTITKPTKGERFAIGKNSGSLYVWDGFDQKWVIIIARGVMKAGSRVESGQITAAEELAPGSTITIKV